MDWLEVSIDTVHEELDHLCRHLEELGVHGLVITDEEVVNDFLENEKKYWDYVDESVVESVRGVSRVTFYLEADQAGMEQLISLRASLGGCTLKTTLVADEDWENNWKQYYKPIESGSRLLIVPEWEEQPASDRTVLRLDPGLIFGTGSHATTRMCLEALEDYAPQSVLDLGCGSGILAIAALLLGAEHALCCDIDEKAPDVVRANAALNGIGPDRLRVLAGDVLGDKRVRDRVSGERYDLVFANIVADVILSLAPDVPGLLREDGVFICSGIIDGREDEVRDALEKAGLVILRHRHVDNWHSFTAGGR